MTDALFLYIVDLSIFGEFCVCVSSGLFEGKTLEILNAAERKRLLF